MDITVRRFPFCHFNSCNPKRPNIRLLIITETLNDHKKHTYPFCEITSGAIQYGVPTNNSVSTHHQLTSYQKYSSLKQFLSIVHKHQNQPISHPHYAKPIYLQLSQINPHLTNKPTFNIPMNLTLSMQIRQCFQSLPQNHCNTLFIQWTRFH